MTTENYIGLLELARMLGVGYWRILYAHKKGALPWPNRFVNTMAYAPDDVACAKAYFATRRLPNGPPKSKRLSRQ
jgi:hypothetical protein